MKLQSHRLGEITILAGALLWSLFPVVTILSYLTLTPLFAAALATLFAALFFALLLTLKGQWPLLLKRKAWKDILFATFYIGILFYGFTFLGLKTTTAGNAAIISQMETFFAFLLLGYWLHHERVTPAQLAGGMAMVLGAALILLPKADSWHPGNWLIVLAAACAPIGNKHAQAAREVVTSEVIMFYRSLLSGAFLLLLAFFVEPLPSIPSLTASAGFLALNGFLLLGLSKILWIEGINRITITEATALNCITPLFTLLFAFLFLHERMTVLQIAGLLPIALGIVLLTKKSNKASIA